MITRFWPFGPHGTIGNDLRGIGDQWRELNAMGIPCFMKDAGSYGPILELLQIGDANGVDNITVYRPLHQDVPNWYAPSPEVAAQEHVQKTLSVLPSEFDKRTWLEIINEPDKDDDINFPNWTSVMFAEWLGKFAQESSKLLLAQNYRVAMFGFSSGEPELRDWEAPAMMDFLRMCGDDPENLAIAVHEYSYNPISLEDATHSYPWLLGRFTKIFDVCDDYAIPRPTILVTEFGWTLWKIPPPEVAIPQLEWAANKVYGPHPEVKGVAIWNFGQGWQDIRYLAQPLLAPMAEKAKTWRMEVDDYESFPIDPVNTLAEALWQVSEFHQIMSYMPEAALQKKIFAHGFVPVSNEYRQIYDGVTYAAQAAERLDNNDRRVYYTEDGNWGGVRFISAPEEEIENPVEPDPVPTPPSPPPVSGTAIDLLPYFSPLVSMGPLYELKDPDGAQRRVQTQTDMVARKFYITKGTGGVDGKSEWEELAWDNFYIWRGADTSPGYGRFYVQYDAGKQMAKWCKRFMKVGEVFLGSPHQVQFFMKRTCESSALNSGSATNHTQLFAHYESVLFNGLTIRDVIELGRPGGERFWFARNIGMIGWKSEWNQSYISELHPPGARSDNEKEPICSFQLP